MIKRLKQAYKLTIVPMMMLLVMASGSYAGDLDPAAGPESNGSAMYTLEDLYNRLDTGTDVAKRAGAFTEPSGDPAAEGRTIDEVLGKMPEADDTDGAATGDVRDGQTFWGLRTDGTWGQQTGTSTTCATCPNPVNLSPAGRWCWRSDGTVKDMTTGLVWLTNAGWGGQYAFWSDTAGGAGTNAHDRAAQLKNGTGGLSDGSAEGDWRLPTKEELDGLATGIESVAGDSPQSFSNVQSGKYWTSTTRSAGTTFAYYRDLDPAAAFPSGWELKASTLYVWPVRSDN